MDVVTGAMSSLLPKLGELLTEEYNLHKSVRGEIRFLKAELESMEAALLKVSEAPVDQHSDIQVKIWARQVRELSYDIEDQVDTFMVRVDHHDTRPPGTQQCSLWRSFINRSVRLLTMISTKRKLGMDIKDIKIRIKEVSERRDRYRVANAAARSAGPTADSLRLSALYKKATELVGVAEKSERLVGMIMEGEETSRKQPRVVSIVGPGGLGKTTLANMVYEKLKGKFSCGAFVSVSVTPLLHKIFKNILHQLDGDKYRNINEETWGETQLIDELRGFLRYKKYFIVLDDIWDSHVWETIKYALDQNEYGSKIITTTRSLDVAKQTGGIYQLEPLSLHDSRKLFYQRIYGFEDQGPSGHLAKVSEKILKKCGGVPLAIITIASLLANKKEKDWSSVYQSMGSGLDGSTNLMNMRRILSVSYYDLPSHLKTCLLYLSLFPEDYVINTRRLIWKWVGEGFVSEEQGKSLSEVGEVYVEELVNRSMIQPVYEGHENKIVACHVHDMVLDLICFLSNEEQFLTKLGGQQPISLPNKIRRLSLHTSDDGDTTKLGNMIFSHVRSLTVSHKVFGLVPSLSTLVVLRVLDLSYCTKVKDQHCKDICNLFHLRYLSLRWTWISEIPEEICKLQFLRVLDISGTRIRNVPPTFIHLPRLRFLGVVPGTLVTLPDGFGNLKSLQEVQGLIRIDSASMLHDLGSLTELRALELYFSNWDESYEKPFIQCLSKLVNLKVLNLAGSDISMPNSGSDDLSPGPQHLHSINMRRCRINAVPRWMFSLSSLSCLDIILLSLGEQDIQVLGSIPSLGYLKVLVTGGTTESRDECLVVGDNNHPFQCLKTLKLIFCGGIVMELIFARGGAMRNLKELHLEFVLLPRKYQLGDFNGLGLEHLPSLELFYIDMGKHVFGPKEEKVAEDAIKKALAMNPNKPTLKSMKLVNRRRVVNMRKLRGSIAALIFAHRLWRLRESRIRHQRPENDNKRPSEAA